MSQSSAAVSDVVAAVTSIPGAVDAVANAPNTIDSIFHVAGRLVYGTGYTLAFLITFPAALVVAAVPKGNALIRGMAEGVAEAQHRAECIVG